MKRGGLLLILGLLVILLVGGYFVLQGGGIIGQPKPTPTATPTQEATFDALIAAVDIPRGDVVSGDYLRTEKKAMALKQPGMLTEQRRDLVVGKTAARDIPEGTILYEDYVVDLEDYLRGSLASLYIPQGSVAVAFPADRLSSVAYALRPGDRVDVIATFLVVDVDLQFQTILPNFTLLLSPDGMAALRDVPIGVEGTLPAANQPINVIPNPTDPYQRPRAVTQLTLQNALVLRMGEWSTLYQPTPVPTRVEITPTRTTTAPQGQQVVPPTPTPIPRPDIVTLAMSRQDALVLMYLMHTGASVELALRPAGDEATDYAPDPVTLYYVFQRFRIPEPPQALPYATEPGLWPLQALPDEVSDPLFLTPNPHPNPTWPSQ